MLEEMLRAQAQALHGQDGDHDTGDFLRRLAVRIHEEAKRPPRVRLAPPGGDYAQNDVPSESLRAPAHQTLTQVAAPAQAPPVQSRTQSSVRPQARRPVRRRPTPIVPPDPGVTPAALLAHVRRLCEVVLRSKDVERLTSFREDYDEAGARTYGCLLYTLGKRESALYWWRFAAGAEDPLAAHLLASHHAAVGLTPDARVWRAFARMLGFTTGHHVPEPVHTETVLAEDFAATLPWDSERHAFLLGLPPGLATR